MDSMLLVGGNLIESSDADALRRRMRELLAHRLELKSLVVLVGAGASFDVGGPRIRGLNAATLSTLAAAVEIDLSPEKSQLADALFTKTDDLERLLQILNALIGYSQTSETTNVAFGTMAFDVRIIEQLRDDLNLILARHCDLIKRAADTGKSLDWTAHREFLRRVVTSQREHPPARVFTTNYDLAIEYAADLNGYTYIDGFKGTVRRRLSPDVYLQQSFLPVAGNSQKFERVQESFYLYKVHGGINWRTDSVGADVVIDGYYSGVKSDSLALIYPTQHKEAEALGYPYADMLRSFSDSLSDGDTLLLTIGYGFRDDHINRLIDRGLAGNVGLQAVIVDPGGIVDAVAKGVPKFADTPIAKYVERKDARIVAITGDCAKFSNFSTEILPDVDQGDPGDTSSAVA